MMALAPRPFRKRILPFLAISIIALVKGIFNFLDDFIIIGEILDPIQFIITAQVGFALAYASVKSQVTEWMPSPIRNIVIPELVVIPLSILGAILFTIDDVTGIGQLIDPLEHMVIGIGSWQITFSLSDRLKLRP